MQCLIDYLIIYFAGSFLATMRQYYMKIMTGSVGDGGGKET